MKVMTQTDELLVLEDRPWGLGIGLALAVVVSLGFALSYLWAGDFGGAVLCLFAFGMCAMAFVAFVRRTIAVLDRMAGTVVVRVASVFGTTETGAALADVRRAELDTRVATRRKDRDTHRPVLRLTDGTTLPLCAVHVSGTGAGSIVAVVNDWLTQA